MFHHKIDRDTPKVVVFHWLLLSFLGGNINAGGLMACGRFVSHVTGFYTLFGEDVAMLKWGAALGIFSIPFCFLIGVIISALLVARPIYRKEKPHYILVMALVCGCLSAVVILGRYGFFGGFGETELVTAYGLLALLCTASGLQNAAVSIASGHTVRITHMTGNTTDLGIGIVRAICMGKDAESRADEVRAMGLRAGIIASFALGATVGAVFFLRFRYNGFLLPAAIALYVLMWEAYFNYRSDKGGGINTLIFIPTFLKRSKNRI